MKYLSIDVGIKNLGICIVDSLGTILFWQIITLSQQPKEDICSCLFRSLDNFDLLNADIVLIEKQPSRNNKMRIIEAFLHSYFIIKGKCNDQSPIKNSIIYSAKHKLGSNTFKGKRSYTERKRLSVTRTKEYIDRTNQARWAIELFQNCKKKDDLADSLLQALSYIGNQTINDISSQELQYTETVKSRKPTAKQTRLGYSRSNIKYFIVNNFDITPKIEKDILKYYSSVDKAKEELS